MSKGLLLRKKKLLIIILAILCCGILFVFSKYSNFLDFNYYTSKSESLSVEQLAVESIKVRYIGGDRDRLDKIFTSDFIKQISDISYFYTNKIFYDIDYSDINNQIDLNQQILTLGIRVYDSGGGYYQVVTIEKNHAGNYLVSNVQIDI